MTGKFIGKVVLVLGHGLFSCILWAGQQTSSQTSNSQILELSMEDLLNVEVTSVSKKPQLQSDAAAAIFVISNDDLLHSGVTNIPDALRMVPGLHIARIDSNKWAVSARGFNDRFANKLQVLIDGRSVYTPGFSGVYWEVQDVLLEDVERIEVIRGPGAALWGANAVNGVINIITKHTAETQGSLLIAGGGTEERVFGAFRYGGALPGRNYGRFYVKGFMRDDFEQSGGDKAEDQWDMVKAGFRLDSYSFKKDLITLQGDLYSGNLNQTVELPKLTPPFTETFQDNANVWGLNLALTWQHILSPTVDYTLKLSFDISDRHELFARDERDTIDIDFQHRYSTISDHDFIWGLRYRYYHDRYSDLVSISFDPDSRNDQLFSGFVHDEITLLKNQLWLTLGSKFEHNDYSGFEVQPTARLLWAPYKQHKFWGAVSRAVRTPARTEHHSKILLTVVPAADPDNPASLPLAIFSVGNQDYQSEEVIAYELGYRFIPARFLSFDVTAFYNDYSRLQNNKVGDFGSKGSYVELPLVYANEIKGETYGIELAIAWYVSDWARLHLAYSYLNTSIDLPRENSNIAQVPTSPDHQVSLRSEIDLCDNLALNLWFRYVDESFGLDSRGSSGFIFDDYITADVGLTWSPVSTIEISIVGQNLLDDRHLEYRLSGFTKNASEVERGVYGKIRWHY